MGHPVTHQLSRPHKGPDHPQLHPDQHPNTTDPCRQPETALPSTHIHPRSHSTSQTNTPLVHEFTSPHSLALSRRCNALRVTLAERSGDFWVTGRPMYPETDGPSGRASLARSAPWR